MPTSTLRRSVTEEHVLDRLGLRPSSADSAGSQPVFELGDEHLEALDAIEEVPVGGIRFGRHQRGNGGLVAALEPPPPVPSCRRPRG